jgi:VIT1/CCC1 family predicted Fe2+/Mn2+ transporter
MSIALWVMAGVLAGVFLGAGAAKLLIGRDQLLRMEAMAWAESFSGAQLRLIGIAEVAGAAGLVLPPLLGIARWLVPLAAAGLALDMLGAFSTHLSRRDPRRAWLPTVVLGAMAFAVAVGRYWLDHT